MSAYAMGCEAVRRGVSPRWAVVVEITYRRLVARRARRRLQADLSRSPRRGSSCASSPSPKHGCTAARGGRHLCIGHHKWCFVHPLP